MSRRSILEYAQALRPRYLRAGKVAKAKILDEFVEATRLHRKSAISLLNREEGAGEGKRQGRPRLYGANVVVAL